MARERDTFKRIEKKYRLSASQHDALRGVVQQRLRADGHGIATVASVYYDTPDRLLIERSISKPLYKEKLRVRAYLPLGKRACTGQQRVACAWGVPCADHVFVEIKKKFRGVVYKRRVAMSHDAAQAYLSGASYADAVRTYPLPGTGRWVDWQISREIDAFLERYEGLRPSMLISCEREAFSMAPSADTPSVEDGPGAGVAGQGKAGGELRITFDARLTCRDLFQVESEALPIIPESEAIMEIKCEGPYPLWLVRALSDARAYPQSFSKYATAYMKYGGLGNARANAAPAQSRPS